MPERFFMNKDHSNESSGQRAYNFFFIQYHYDE